MSTFRASLAGASLISILAGGALAQDILREHQLPLGSPAPQILGLGDVTGDGVADFAVGLPLENRGTVRVYSGASQLPIFSFSGDASTPQLGSVLASIGDVDLDGITDLAVTAGTSVRVYSLGTRQPLYTVTGGSLDRFGYAVCGAGDVNGDGRADFAVGAPQCYVFIAGDHFVFVQNGLGFVRIFSGLDGSVVRTINGLPNQLAFGGVIANGGNLDGDGIDDLLAGQSIENGLVGNQKVFGFAGSNAAQILQVPLYSSGVRLARLADVNSDGFDDFVIGEPLNSVRVLSGRTGALLYFKTGIGTHDHFGASISALDDVDGDGAPDLLVGAPQPIFSQPFQAPIYPGPGYARVLSGRTGAELETLVGNRINQGFGTNVSALGDVDADGKPEILVTGLKDASGKGFVRV
ncbi:MAG: hypothetical protein ABI054_10885, partial [Planctomycetota bacterium]